MTDSKLRSNNNYHNQTVNTVKAYIASFGAVYILNYTLLLGQYFLARIHQHVILHHAQLHTSQEYKLSYNTSNYNDHFNVPNVIFTFVLAVLENISRRVTDRITNLNTN